MAGAVLVMLAAPAFAHVTLNPSEAAKGAFTKLAFNVPNEQDTGDTIKVEVKFPTDHPIASVSVKPHPGWTYTVQKDKLATPITTDDGTVTDAVSLITWSGGKIAPGEFDEFEVSAGPLPDDVDSLTFPTIQTYSDGSAVSWIEDTPPGGPEPAHPAPVLTLTAAASSESSSSSSSTTATSPSVSSSTTAAKSSSSDDSKGLAVAALVVAVIALVLGGVGLFRPRASSPAR